MRKHGFGKGVPAFCLALMLLIGCVTPAAAQEPAAYTGAVLAAINTKRTVSFGRFTTDREQTETSVEAAAEPAEEQMLPDAPLDDVEPLSGAQALLRQAQVGDVEPQAAACYRVGDVKQIVSHYAVSEGKDNRAVDVVCTAVSETATVWRERGTENDYTESDEKLAAELDEMLPKELEFYGDKRIDTDGDGKIAVLLYEIDGVNIGGYFSVVDLMDRIGRIGPVWNPYLDKSNHMDCIHVQGARSYSFIMETCLHEYQHYIEASYRFVGRNNFTVLRATETYINEGFSTGAEFLLYGYDRYTDGFARASRPSRGLAFLDWRHDNGNYSMAFVFSQYIRTRYAALTNDLDSDIPGGTIYKKILESRTPKNDKDTMKIIADVLYPAADYPELKDSEARSRQLLCDFWLAAFCREPEGVHGFNGESWANRINARELVEPMPAGASEDLIRNGMAGFYQIVSNETDTVCVTQSSAELQFTVPAAKGFTVRFDANGGVGAPEAQVLCERCTIPQPPTRVGSTFLGWAPTADAASPQYYTGSTYRLTADMTLYAVWQQSPVVVTDTSYPMRRQGRENRNDYVFVPETDGVYKLTYSHTYGAWMSLTLDGEWIETVYHSTTADYYRLTGGTAYDLSLTWSRTPPTSGSGTFRLTRQETYYTLTYRFDHPLVAMTWSYSGETEYVLDSLDMPLMPRFLGWALAENGEVRYDEGDTITLTQDTTLYAVCAPDVILPTDGTPARAQMINGAFLYVLRPQTDGMYELCWQPDGETENGGASFCDATGSFLRHMEPGTAAVLALRGGETYYLYGDTDTSAAVATCKMTSNRITARLTFSVGKNALLDLTLRGKAVYTVPDYTPAALDGRTFLGWEDESDYTSYAAGDMFTITEDTVLKAKWSRTPEERVEIVRAVANWVPRVFNALWRNLALRIADLVTR